MSEGNVFKLLLAKYNDSKLCKNLNEVGKLFKLLLFINNFLKFSKLLI